MMPTYYITSYCNKPHRVVDGKPLKHECRVIPPTALRAEIRGEFGIAMDILAKDKPRYMRRGVNE